MNTHSFSFPPARLLLVTASVLTFLAVLQPETFAQRRTTVEVGKTRSRGFNRAVNEQSIKITVSDGDIVGARFDRNTNLIRVTGLKPGTAKVTVRGTFREILVGARLIERAKPFESTIYVTVLPATSHQDERTIRLSAAKGNTRTWSLHILLGPEFRNNNEQGIRWRNLSLRQGNPAVAIATLDELRISIKGIGRGRTTILVSGERHSPAGWQRVVRRLNIRVG